MRNGHLTLREVTECNNRPRLTPAQAYEHAQAIRRRVRKLWGLD